MPDYKQVIHERLYLKEPGTERFRKTSAGRLKRMLAEGWRETERWHAEDHITVRLDRQANTSAGAANLQIQVNNVALSRIRLTQTEGTTIAQVIVPAAIFRSAFTCHELNVRSHLENVVRSALLSSYSSVGYQYTIVEDKKT